jgi:Protein of unknown function (DUF3040)
MALSMEEERILAEIALQLSADDPGLARRLGTLDRRPRKRGTRRVFTVAVAVVLIVSMIAAAFVSAFAH